MAETDGNEKYCTSVGNAVSTFATEVTKESDFFFFFFLLN
jgi:hypothetical protein